MVNEQTLPVKTGALYATTPDDISLSLTTTLHTPLGATVSALTLELYNANTTEFKPFGDITLPQLYLDGHKNNSITNQTVAIRNQEELVKWFDSYFIDADVQLSVVADPEITVSMGVPGVETSPEEDNPHAGAELPEWLRCLQA